MTSLRHETPTMYFQLSAPHFAADTTVPSRLKPIALSSPRTSRLFALKFFCRLRSCFFNLFFKIAWIQLIKYVFCTESYVFPNSCRSLSLAKRMARSKSLRVSKRMAFVSIAAREGICSVASTFPRYARLLRGSISSTRSRYS